MNELLIILSGLPLGIWVYLLLCHGMFWREPARPAPTNTDLSSCPDVVAVVPARNEAAVIAPAIRSLLGQSFGGEFSIIVVDDGSEDGTSSVVTGLLTEMRPSRSVTVLRGKPLPRGWTGKVWAQHQGIAEASRLFPKAKYIWLTDADIAHGPEVLAGLVARAEEGGLTLTSLMAKLKTETFAERILIPAYVFFFQMLYPFAWVNDPKRRMAGAAGGCMLVRMDALAKAGGIGAIRNALIDDCSLGKLMKGQGPIWLGLAGDSHSLRGYPRWRDIWMLIARSAYTQLGHSPLLLLGCVIGMAATYLAPPVLTASSDVGIRAFGLMAWAAMALSLVPTLQYYGRSVIWAPLLPLVALFYTAATIDSARRHLMGKGGEWKGRLQAENAKERAPRRAKA